MKDAHHAHSNEGILKAKVQSILDCYLESSLPPPLQVIASKFHLNKLGHWRACANKSLEILYKDLIFQIDIPSEMQQKTVRAAQKYLAGKDFVPTVFDEAQYQVFKELLPYWAGFKKVFRPPEDQNKKPSRFSHFDQSLFCLSRDLCTQRYTHKEVCSSRSDQEAAVSARASAQHPHVEASNGETAPAAAAAQKRRRRRHRRAHSAQLLTQQGNHLEGDHSTFFLCVNRVQPTRVHIAHTGAELSLLSR